MRLLRNSKGFTLFEVLAVIVILAIVSMLSISLVTSATKQQIEQGTHNRDIKELSYALKMITKDFRRSEDFIIDDTTTPETILYKFTLLNNTEIATYKLENNQIIRSSSIGQEIVALNVDSFDISSTGSIIIKSEDGQTATAEITIRRGTK
ncbi:prepilin-type N-terminal cleavage/methylation domain-containing protein [Metasolibacillus fluoroglycofenilyticus]|uniref:prepilin-type N-terminal cleavage/methylation domain-containing protein n=1 Tax=Metasolibacillus fluoroglycofenilyticus TaxID=1239396 RepID=UPI000D3839F7|nr:prepilin-type N-terminal cleavage/methylation domain-containing protein [Metasolibacillus fluoroglycofenilyticus]